MILVDSSVWIDYFCGRDTPETEIFDRTLGVQAVAIGDLILTEALQGFRLDKHFNTAKESLEELAIFKLLGKEGAIKSAEDLRKLRKRGATNRKTADAIIASFCIEHGLPLLFSDKDFKSFVTELGLIEAR